MVRMKAIYQGDKHCLLVHEPSSTRIETDAPRDNAGKGERFSPTDLVGAALASCILTTMAIVAERDGISIQGAEADVEKEMNSNPRRIARLSVRVQMPAGIPQDYRRKLEIIAHACPVHKSLHPEVDLPIQISYPD